MYDNVTQIGNIASTSHVVALARAIASGRVKQGTDVMFVIQSSGLNIGVLHYKMDDLAGRVRSLKKSNHEKLLPPDLLGDITQQTLNTESTRRLKIITCASVNDRQLDTVDSAVNALKSCLEMSQVEPHQLSHLVHAGLYRSNSMEEPSHASLIAGGIGLTSNANHRHLLSFDIVNDGLGWMNALFALTHLVEQDGTRYVAITASECDENKVSSRGDPLNISELGTCTLLGLSHDKSGFSHFHFRSFTDHINDNEVRYIADGPAGYHLRTTCSQFESNIQNAIRDTVTDELNKLNLTMSDFRAVILPQRSAKFVEQMARILKIECEKVVSICNDENLFSSSIPLAMQAILNKSSLKAGEKLLVVDVASGIQVGVAIYIV
jgi:3-oxoacyl-[acyl-carrier-protein] synthase III